ncbi:MAG: DUF2059 domain-containing protein [Planctomycetota bacterium]
MLRKLLLGASLGAILTTPFVSLAAPDDQSHRAAAETMLTAANVETSMNSVLDQTLDMQIKANPQLAPLRPVMSKFLSKHLSYEALKEELITMYTEEFTEEELLEIAAFYQTPTGRKAMEKMPVLFQRGSELGNRRVQENTPELRKMIQEEMKRQNAM